MTVEEFDAMLSGVKPGADEGMAGEMAQDMAEPDLSSEMAEDF